MGLTRVLTSVLAKAAGMRAHVLVAEAPGAFRERAGLERAMDQRGWVSAGSVADADVLAVVGEPGEDLALVVEHVWAQMSEPRVRLHVHAGSDVEALLSEAQQSLAGDSSADATEEIRSGFTPSADEMSGHEGDHDDDHEGDHEVGHHHDAMMPSGIPLAEGAEDRDGLEMDELHLPLGPVLAHWPAGLVLRVTLHGDVVVDADVEQLTASVTDQGGDDAATRAARLLDAASSVLALAGLPADSTRVRRLRERCLDGDLDGSEVAAVGQRIGRRRTLRWILGGLSIEGSHGGAMTLHERLAALFEDARSELAGETTGRVGPGVEALPGLVRGLELASVRLWVAALAPDLVVHEVAEATDG